MFFWTSKVIIVSLSSGPGVGHAHHADEDHARDPLAEGADRGQGTGDREAGETISRDREVAEEGRDPNLRIEEDLMKSPKGFFLDIQLFTKSNKIKVEIEEFK